MRDSDLPRSINAPDDPNATEAGYVLPLSILETANEFMLAERGGGRGAEISPMLLPRMRTRQQAYRFAAWCETMADVLPNEPGSTATYEQIRAAIRNI